MVNDEKARCRGESKKKVCWAFVICSIQNDRTTKCIMLTICFFIFLFQCVHTIVFFFIQFISYLFWINGYVCVYLIHQFIFYMAFLFPLLNCFIFHFYDSFIVNTVFSSFILNSLSIAIF